MTAAADVRRLQPLEVDDGFAACATAGEQRVGEFRCTECGYGIVSRRTLPACPMCQGKAWEESLWGPFTRSREPH
jgi:rubrerythrin